MFFRIFTFFALVAMAFAAPKPDPQVITYSAPAVYPASAYSAYSAYAPVAYSAYAAPYAAYPYAYSSYYLK